MSSRARRKGRVAGQREAFCCPLLACSVPADGCALPWARPARAELFPLGSEHLLGDSAGPSAIAGRGHLCKGRLLGLRARGRPAALLGGWFYLPGTEPMRGLASPHLENVIFRRIQHWAESWGPKTVPGRPEEQLPQLLQLRKAPADVVRRSKGVGASGVEFESQPGLLVAV